MGVTGLGRLPTLESRRARYLVFGCTYGYQGLVAGFSLTALANYYAGRGLPAIEVGLHFAIAGLPWTVQPLLWGPLVDRASGFRMGRRRFWSVAAIVAAQAMLGLLLLVPNPDALLAIGLIFFGHSACAALLDTACDRLIMDHVPEDELGRTSGVSRGGFVLGTSLSAALFSWALPELGFHASAGLLLAVGSLLLLPALLVREKPGDALLSFARRGGEESAPQTSFAQFAGRLLAALRQPAALWLLALCFGVDFALSLFELRFNVEVVQTQGWDAGSLSRLQAGLGLVSGTLGALGIGLWSDRAGPLPALTGLYLGAGVAFGVAALLLGLGAAGPTAPIVLGLTNVLPSLVIVALTPILMRASRNRPGAATEFELFMAMMNLGSVAGGLAAGLSAALVAPTSLAVFVALVLLAAAMISRRPEVFLNSASETVQTCSISAVGKKRA